MTSEAYQAPEVLFNPSIVGLEYPGVGDCLSAAIMRSDLDLRKTLYNQIVIAGGSTLMRGAYSTTACKRPNSSSTPMRSIVRVQ